MWGTGMRKTPNLTAEDIAKCVPIGLMACISHAGSVLAVSVVYHIYNCIFFTMKLVLNISQQYSYQQ